MAAVVAAVFWAVPFFGLIDLMVPIDRTPGFAESYLVETGWGLFYTVLVAVPLLALAARPRSAPPLWQLAASAAALALTASATSHWGHLLPAVGILASASAVALLAGRRRPPPLMQTRWGRPTPRWALLLTAIAVVPCVAYAVDMVASARQDRSPVDVTWGLNHWPTQAALPVAVLLVALIAVVGRDGWSVPGWCAATTAVWIGTVAWVNPGLAGGFGRVWASLAVAWGLLFGVACARAARQTRPTET